MKKREREKKEKRERERDKEERQKQRQREWEGESKRKKEYVWGRCFLFTQIDTSVILFFFQDPVKTKIEWCLCQLVFMSLIISGKHPVWASEIKETRKRFVRQRKKIRERKRERKQIITEVISSIYL